MNGSVFKRCSGCGTTVREQSCRKCGGTSISWAYSVRIGRNADGRWQQRLRSGFKTKREAQHALLEVTTSLHNNTYVAPSKLTVGRFLTEEWLPATAPPQVRYETWNDRRRNLTSHVVPHVGNVVLQELTASQLNRLYGRLLSDGRVDGEGGLSPTSVRRIHAMLRKAFNDAVRWGLLERNVVTLADPPPAKAVAAARRRSMQTWTADELRQFLDATAGHLHHPMWLFAASTGIRRSELLGLRWHDIDLAARTASIRQTLIDGEDGYRLEDDQKSLSAGRTIHLDQRTARMLRRHQQAQERVRELLGTGWQDHGLVFPQHDGSWWNPPAVSLAFRRAVKAVGVPRIRFHDLRHTHASLLLRARVNPKVVSERLGHSSVAFTLDTYAHIMPGMQPEAAEQFMDLLYGPEELPGDQPQSGDSPAS